MLLYLHLRVVPEWYGESMLLDLYWEWHDGANGGFKVSGFQSFKVVPSRVLYIETLKH